MLFLFVFLFSSLVHLCFAYSYEFETSVRWVVNSTLNPSPCAMGSPADLSQGGKLPAAPPTGEHLHTCTLVKNSKVTVKNV